MTILYNRGISKRRVELIRAKLSSTKTDVVDSCLVENNEWDKIDGTLGNGVFSFGDSGIELYSGTSNDIWVSGYFSRSAVGRKFITSVDAIGYYATIFFATNSIDTEAFAQVNNTPRIRFGKRVSGAFSFWYDLDTIYNGTDTIKFIVKAFDDFCFFIVMINNEIIKEMSIIDTDITTMMTGARVGIAAREKLANLNRPVIYNNFKFKRIYKFVNVVCLGDSNTTGSAGTPQYNPGYNNIYPSLLNRIFANEHVAVTNAGVSGDETTDVSARLTTDLINKKIADDDVTNICTLLIGANDFNIGAKSVADTITDLNTLIDSILADGWTLCVMTYPPYDDISPDLRELNVWIRDNSYALGYDVIDLYPEFALGESDDELRPDLMYAKVTGGYHYNASGHNIIANRIKEYLLSIL